MKLPPERHLYSALIAEVIDGDTLVADIDLGFGIWRKGQHIRLLGCNCPETKGKTLDAGLQAKAFTVGWLTGDPHARMVIYAGAGRLRLATPVPVILRTYVLDTDAFGRVLARVWLESEQTAEDLSTVLVEHGQAVVFMEEAGYH